MLFTPSHTHMHTVISTFSTMSCSQSTQTDMSAASNQQSGTMSLRVSTVEELNNSRKWARRVTGHWFVHTEKEKNKLHTVAKLQKTFFSQSIFGRTIYIWWYTIVMVIILRRNQWKYSKANQCWLWSPHGNSWQYEIEPQTYALHLYCILSKWYHRNLSWN